MSRMRISDNHRSGDQLIHCKTTLLQAAGDIRGRRWFPCKMQKRPELNQEKEALNKSVVTDESERQLKIHY